MFTPPIPPTSPMLHVSSSPLPSSSWSGPKLQHKHTLISTSLTPSFAPSLICSFFSSLSNKQTSRPAEIMDHDISPTDAGFNLWPNTTAAERHSLHSPEAKHCGGTQP
ncbi:unnamed protein product [Pleuronectes platessa]|uniref:Uncharacterized protein n=1 Tax=Pleuronectes platessa TaxID=8262 RepID=A0A9N7TGP6_PLEPL|nr:unnamed protein product [Pleuronectes platessa]